MLAHLPDLLQGTLDLLILKSLASASLHGWAISKRIRQMSSDVLTVNQGSLYPAPSPLEGWGLSAGQAGASPRGPPHQGLSTDSRRPPPALARDRRVALFRAGHRSRLRHLATPMT